MSSPDNVKKMYSLNNNEDVSHNNLLLFKTVRNAFYFRVFASDKILQNLLVNIRINQKFITKKLYLFKNLKI
jgi:hypothetical protein